MKFLLFLSSLISFSSYAYDYGLYIPKGLEDKENLPLVVMLHGCTQNDKDFMELTRIKDEADKRGFIVLAPNKGRRIFPPSNPLLCWSWYDLASNERAPKRGDLKALMDIINEVKINYKIDEHKIFLAGFSAGAVMSSIMASCYPDLFTGVAIHAGIPYKGLDSYLSSRINLEQFFQENQNLVSLNEIKQKLTDEQNRRIQNLQKKSFECAKEVLDKKLQYISIFQGEEDRIVLPRSGANVFFQFLPQNLNDSELLIFSRISGQEGKLSFRKIEYRGKIDLQLIQIEKMGHSWSGGKSGFSFSDPHGPDATELMLNQFGL
ncbi:MAG: PHB depolymerase family esterase [Bacteriovoracaceae bacterium]